MKGDATSVLMADDHGLIEWQRPVVVRPGPARTPERALLVDVLGLAVLDASRARHGAREWLREPNGHAALYCTLLDIEHDALVTHLDAAWRTSTARVLPLLKQCPGVAGRCHKQILVSWAHCQACRTYLNKVANRRRHRGQRVPCPGVPDTRRARCGVRIYGRLCFACKSIEQHRRHRGHA